MATVIEIGSLRERVELLEAPRTGRHPRVGRIRHANGESVAIDSATLAKLEERARLARTGSGTANPNQCVLIA